MQLSIESALSLEGLLGHIAYILLISSMLMRKMVWLRILVILSSISGIGYSWFILTDPVSSFWKTLLILVNVLQLALSWWLDRRAQFSPIEDLMIERHFATVPRGRVRKLLKLGAWATVPAGTVLTREGEAVEKLTYLATGSASVKVGGSEIAVGEAGGFVGEMTALSGETAFATVTLREEATVWQADAKTLREVAARHTDIGRVLESAFFRMLRQRLNQRNLRDSAARAAVA
jgi:hypothetical protein